MTNCKTSLQPSQLYDLGLFQPYAICYALGHRLSSLNMVICHPTIDLIHLRAAEDRSVLIVVYDILMAGLEKLLERAKEVSLVIINHRAKIISQVKARKIKRLTVFLAEKRRCGWQVKIDNDVISIDAKQIKYIERALSPATIEDKAWSKGIHIEAKRVGLNISQYYNEYTRSVNSKTDLNMRRLGRHYRTYSELISNEILSSAIDMKVGGKYQAKIVINQAIFFSRDLMLAALKLTQVVVIANYKPQKKLTTLYFGGEVDLSFATRPPYNGHYDPDGQRVLVEVSGFLPFPFECKNL